MAENRLSTITQFEEITPADDDILLVSHKDSDQYVSRRAKISKLPFAYSDKYATTESVGLMQVGNGLKADIYGKVEVDYSKLPVANKDELGVIKVGANLSIDDNGILSAGNPYELQIATSGKLGGVKIGAGIDIAEDGTLSVPVSGVTKIKAGTNISITPADGTGEVTISANKQIDHYVSKIIAGDNIAISSDDGTGEVTISAIVPVDVVKKVNDIAPDINGNVTLGFEENELYKFKNVTTFDDLADLDIRSGFVYYTIGTQVEGKPLAYIDKMCVAMNIWTFITPTVHSLTIPAGTYDIVAVGGGGIGWSSHSIFNASGGSGACMVGTLQLTEETQIEISVGNIAQGTSIKKKDDNTTICFIENGTNGGSGDGTGVAGSGGKSEKCVIDKRIVTQYVISSGNDGAKSMFSGSANGGSYANNSYKYGGGQGVNGGISYDPQTGYVKIVKVESDI